MEAQQISSTEEEAWYKRQIHEKYEVSTDSYYWGRERLPYLQLEILKIVKFGPPTGGRLVGKTGDHFFHVLGHLESICNFFSVNIFIQKYLEKFQDFFAGTLVI